MNCLDNLSRCEAECCRTMAFSLPKKPRSRGALLLNVGELSDDMRWYYLLHGLGVGSDEVLIPAGTKKEWRDGKLIVYRRCRELSEDFLCRIHDSKPEVCRALSHETKHEQRFFITKNCIFKRGGD